MPKVSCTYCEGKAWPRSGGGPAICRACYQAGKGKRGGDRQPASLRLDKLSDQERVLYALAMVGRTPTGENQAEALRVIAAANRAGCLAEAIKEWGPQAFEQSYGGGSAKQAMDAAILYGW